MPVHPSHQRPPGVVVSGNDNNDNSDVTLVGGGLGAFFLFVVTIVSEMKFS